MFNEDDLKKYAALAKLIELGQFDLEGKAVMQNAFLFKWYAELGQQIKASILEAEQTDEEKEDDV